MQTGIFAGIDLPIVGHLSTPVLIAIAILAYVYRAKISALFQPQVPTVPTLLPAPVVAAPAPQPATPPTPPATIAKPDFTPLETLIEHRDRLDAEVAEALEHAKSIIQQEEAGE
jgi:hypothetical protein